MNSICILPFIPELGVSLITGLLITGLDWTGILKFVFTHCGMQLKINYVF